MQSDLALVFFFFFLYFWYFFPRKLFDSPTRDNSGIETDGQVLFTISLIGIDNRQTLLHYLSDLRQVQKYLRLYNNQINARALIGQSAVGYCAGKPTEKSSVL